MLSSSRGVIAFTGCRGKVLVDPVSCARVLAGTISRLSSDRSCHKLFRRRERNRPLPSKGSLRHVMRLSHTVLFPNCFNGSAVGDRAVGCRVNIGVRRLFSLLVRRVRTKLYFKIRGSNRYSYRSPYHTATARLTTRFVDHLPRVQQVLTASMRTTCCNSPTTAYFNRVVYYCPIVHTIAGCQVTRRLRQLGIPLVPHVVARVTRSRAKVSVRPNTRVKRRFAVSRNANIMVNTAYVVNGRIGLCRNIALNTGDFPYSRRKGPVGNVPHRPVLRSGIVICSGTAVLKHVAVNRKTAVKNGV